jgi:ketosteroid isomerase-like protein
MRPRLERRGLTSWTCGRDLACVRGEFTFRSPLHAKPRGVIRLHLHRGRADRVFPTCHLPLDRPDAPARLSRVRWLGLVSGRILHTSPMSSANLDLVRSIYAAQEHGDFTSAEWAHPEIDYEIADGPSPGRWKGRAAMAETWREFLTAWDHLRIEVQEYRELDDERVFVLTRSSARGKASGLELPPAWTNGAAIYQVRDGKVRRHVVYFDRENAIADLGLTPDTGP